jgi:hypothetical protein
MRSTRAAAAIERLKVRSSNDAYSMVRTTSGLFYLVLISGSGAAAQLSEPLELDAFVTFVNGFGPQTPKRVSKLDIAFEKQLQRKKT